MLETIDYKAYRIGFLKACMNYYTYDLERTIERKEKDCTGEDEKIGYTDVTIDLARYKNEIDKFARAICRRIYT